MSIDGASTLDELFRPSSVAVNCASNRPGKVGTSLFRNILQAGFRGVAYPVNPSWKSVSGVRCYPSVSALPEPPELAVVIVPAAGVPEVRPVVKSSPAPPPPPEKRVIRIEGLDSGPREIPYKDQ